MSKIIKRMLSRLKYFSMKFLMGDPNFQISAATIKNLVLLPIMDANVKSQKSNLKTPDAIVKTL